MRKALALLGWLWIGCTAEQGNVSVEPIVNEGPSCSGGRTAGFWCQNLDGSNPVLPLGEARELLIEAAGLLASVPALDATGEVAAAVCDEGGQLERQLAATALNLAANVIDEDTPISGGGLYTTVGTVFQAGVLLASGAVEGDDEGVKDLLDAINNGENTKLGDECVPDDDGGGGEPGGEPGGEDDDDTDQGPPDGGVGEPACGMPSLPGPCTIVVDEPVGGGFDEVVQYTWDEQGRIARIEHDDLNDGVADRIELYGYEGGFLARIEFDNDADGALDTIDHFEFDAAGNQTQVARDSDADGDVDVVLATSYDDAGHAIEQRVDAENDGIWDARTTYTYEGDRLVLAEQDVFADPGEVDFRIAQAFDGRGLLVRRDIDVEADGEVDVVEAWAYDERCNLTGHTQDIDGDGVRDLVERVSYDAENNVVTEDTDRDGDGVVDKHRIFTYECFQ